ncbi:MAG: hypothetical protein CL534_09020 [Ahrensia sp.]|nr:hypothetical protein [Ahrensia sp.]
MQHATNRDYRRWVAQLDKCENAINKIQDMKKKLYTEIRTEHGKVTADALKSAMRVYRMDDQKRDQMEEVSAEAQRILDIVKPVAKEGAVTAEAEPQADDMRPEVDSPVAEVSSTSVGERGEEGKSVAQSTPIQLKPTIDDLVLDSAENSEEEHIEEIVEAA